MPEAKFHQKIAWFNFICCLMVIWTHSGNADLFFPELGQDAPWWHFQYPVMQEILRVDIPCFIMLSGCHQFCLFFLFLGLWTDCHKIEDGNDKYKVNDHSACAAHVVYFLL